MKRYRYVLVDIDTQNDFLDPKGALYMPGAAEIIPNLERVFRWAKTNQAPVISIIDSHIPDDPEFQEFPPHCVVGTWGHEKNPATVFRCYRLEGSDEKRIADAKTIFDHIQQVIYQKQTYHVFDNKNIAIVLAEVPAEIFVVCGVATDYCVQAVVNKLLDLKKSVWLVIDTIAAVNPAKANSYLESFLARGVKFIKSIDLK